MLLSKDGQSQPANLRFGLVLWFGICIFAYSFLPVAPEAANAAENIKNIETIMETAINAPPVEGIQQLPLTLLLAYENMSQDISEDISEDMNGDMYAAKSSAREQLAERAAAFAAAEAEAKAKAEAAAAAEAQTAAAQYAGRELVVPTSRQANSGFKSFMDYRALQNRSSSQYILQQDAATDEQGFRVYDGCYMVALGTYYAKSVGERFRITLDSGESFLAITGDIKSDAHTDALHQHRNGNIVEFIVDTSRISAQCRRMGDMSYAGFGGRIKSIERLN